MQSPAGCTVKIGVILAVLLDMSCQKIAASKKDPIVVCELQVDKAILNAKGESLAIEGLTIAALPSDSFQTSEGTALLLSLVEAKPNQKVDIGDRIIARVANFRSKKVFGGDKIYLRLGTVDKRETSSTGVTTTTSTSLLVGSCAQGESIKVSSMKSAPTKADKT